MNRNLFLLKFPVVFLKKVVYNITEQKNFRTFKKCFWPTRPYERKNNLTDEVALVHQSRVWLVPYPFYFTDKEER